MGKALIIGNWKMNLTVHEASIYMEKVLTQLRSHRDVEVVVAPTMLTLQSLSLQVKRRVIKLAAQNCYWRDHGAYTGEVSAAHLRGLVDYVLIGHSERRQLFLEQDRDLRMKVQAALRNQLQPVLCVGETAQERAQGETADVLRDQLASGLANVTADELSRVVVAYEPVWAIGSGDGARPADVAAAVAAIHQQLIQLFGPDAAAAVRVLYGGSVSIDNAAEYLTTVGVGGLLVGNASLNAAQFVTICDKAHNTPGRQEGR